MATPVFTYDNPMSWAECGVTLSASTVRYSEEWMRALLSHMARARMNVLLWEVKIARGESGAKSTTGFITSQPFVTPEEAHRIIGYARELGIAVIPEINSPGHLRTWLTHYPEFAIRDAKGERDLERLDVLNPEAVQWYLDLADSYAEVFDSPWWHMGADEFENELDHRTYADYPQLAAAAVERYGVGAQPWDVNMAFVNTVAEHMRRHGLKLRIWNDGLRRGGKVQLDPSIIVEYWIDKGANYLNPCEIAAAGHDLINVPQRLYFSRSEKHIYSPNAQAIAAAGRAGLALFDGDQVLPAELAHKQRGIRVSLWPDRAECQSAEDFFAEAQDMITLVGELAGKA